MTTHSDRTSPDRSPITDPALAEALGALYAAPADDAYWAGLEGRIMARLRQAETPLEWWNVLAEWKVARVAGLVAAGLMLTLAGFSLWKERQIDADLRKLAAGAAYWTVFDLSGNEDATIAFTVPSSGDRKARADRHLFNAEP
jgi:anti-sigma-K factor RskA